MTRDDVEGLPISECQKRFFIEWALRPDEDGYNVFGVYRIRGALDTERFKRACARFLRQHEEVHAVYAEDGESCHRAPLGVEELDRHEVVTSSTAAVRLVEDAVQASCDLARWPIPRLHLVSFRRGRRRH